MIKMKLIVSDVQTLTFFLRTRIHYISEPFIRKTHKSLKRDALLINTKLKRTMKFYYSFACSLQRYSRQWKKNLKLNRIESNGDGDNVTLATVEQNRNLLLFGSLLSLILFFIWKIWQLHVYKYMLKIRN